MKPGGWTCFTHHLTNCSLQDSGGSEGRDKVEAAGRSDITRQATSEAKRFAGLHWSRKKSASAAYSSQKELDLGCHSKGLASLRPLLKAVVVPNCLWLNLVVVENAWSTFRNLSCGRWVFHLSAQFTLFQETNLCSCMWEERQPRITGWKTPAYCRALLWWCFQQTPSLGNIFFACRFT